MVMAELIVFGQKWTNEWRTRTEESHFKTFAHLFSLCPTHSPNHFRYSKCVQKPGRKSIEKLSVGCFFFQFFFLFFLRFLHNGFLSMVLPLVRFVSYVSDSHNFSVPKIFGEIVKTATQRRATFHFVMRTEWIIWTAWIFVCVRAYTPESGCVCVSCCDWLFELLLFNQMAYSSGLRSIDVNALWLVQFDILMWNLWIWFTFMRWFCHAIIDISFVIDMYFSVNIEFVNF